jgi:TonB-dependent SusC/RagA subfamily outer membrane receptor
MICLLCLLAQGALAQSKVISGTIEDPMGPVMFANVTERDKDDRIVSAVQTDMMGNFSLEIKNPKNRLVISYVGNKTKELAIGEKSYFTIMMEPESTSLEELVVQATRTTSGGLSIPEREMTVARQTFNLAEVEGMAFTSADEALQGEIAGLDIVMNSGNLGAGTTMRLRGVTSINGNAEPLVVVDDKIFDNPDGTFDFQNASDEEYAALLSVNVEDIADINVLKDAAATAVWGSKGANGVILITTKRGNRGKPRVNFSYKYTGTWQPKGYDLLSGDDYTMLLKEEYYNPNQSNTATANIREINYDKSWAEYQNWNNNTDWVDLVTQFGSMHSYNLNISGGGEKAQFRISGGYDKQSGSIIQQELDRLTTRLVLDYDVSDRI